MTNPDIIWNLIIMLLDRIEKDSSMEKKESNDKNN